MMQAKIHPADAVVVDLPIVLSAEIPQCCFGVEKSPRLVNTIGSEETKWLTIEFIPKLFIEADFAEPKTIADLADEQRRFR